MDPELFNEVHGIISVLQEREPDGGAGSGRAEILMAEKNIGVISRRL